MRAGLFPGTVLFCGLLTAASAQVTLFSSTFESDTLGNLPAGWTSGGNTFKAIANPSTGGINSSAKVGSWTGDNSTDKALIDLTGYTSGYVFTFSFDLYDPDSTNNHGLLTGYGINSGGSDHWTIGSTLLNSGPAVLFDDLTSAGQWQHFSFDFTSVVSDYLGDHSGQAANFALMFDMWSAGGNARSSIDNVTFIATPTVPEPSTYAALAGLAALGLAALRRRRAA